ncbi:RICIN domain-containing protein [Streptomyces bikiniensis]|uniref:RICIN domain-containing protein n=1 Tax=Streptomyces bikiniensis TaxID=1896 RepID=UPI000691EF1F|nr:RICIN domain-containing protein [Streptomyces bikiniensis]
MRAHSFRAGALALLAAAGFLATGTTAVGAQPPAHAGAGTDAGVPRAADAVQTFANMATGSCLDDSRQYGLRGYGCNGGVHQQWNVRAWNDGTRRLRNIATNECLYDNGVTLDTRTCDSSREQSWFPHKSGDKVTLQSQATGECLDDSAFGLRTIRCNGGRNQTWR